MLPTHLRDKSKRLVKKEGRHAAPTIKVANPSYQAEFLSGREAGDGGVRQGACSGPRAEGEGVGCGEQGRP